MNTAFLDAQNLAWKIHHVESGFAKRDILKSYEIERKSVAENLLNFDAQYASLFSQRQPSAGEVGQASSGANEGQEENKFVDLFKSSCEFTSGYGVAYGPNVFNWHQEHSARSSLFQPQGSTLRTGRILPPANVIRVVDANEVHLEEEIPTNGAFRIYLFAGEQEKTRQAITDFAANLVKRNSFYQSHLFPNLKNVSYHERHLPHSPFFTICTIFANERASIEVDKLPEVLARYSSHVYADVVPDPRVPNAKAAAHAKMGLEEDKGGVVIVRPDAYVGCVVGLSEGSETVNALNQYFGAFTTKKLGSESTHARL
jgi:hypothetical protein